MKTIALNFLLEKRLAQIEHSNPFRVSELVVITKKIKEVDVISILDLFESIESKYVAVCPNCCRDVYYYDAIPAQEVVHFCKCKHRFQLKLDNVELVYKKIDKSLNI